MAGRKRRGLSAEDAELWARVTAAAVPLRPTQKAAVPPEAFVSKAVGWAGEPGAAAPTLAPRFVGQVPLVTVDLAPDPHAALADVDPRMDRRRFEKLRRGRLAPEARLDLHGMSTERAHDALRGFILSAHAAGLRLALVITGKGRGSSGEGLVHRAGILRHQVPHWLATPPLASKVLQVAPAHLRHGGSGAYYVYLRRRR